MVIDGSFDRPVLVGFWADWCAPCRMLMPILAKLADVVLFGSFLAWAVADRISMKHRVQRPVPGAPPSKLNDLIAVVAGLALYVAFVLWLHRWLIGVPPVG